MNPLRARSNSSEITLPPPPFLLNCSAHLGCARAISKWHDEWPCARSIGTPNCQRRWSGRERSHVNQIIPAQRTPKVSTLPQPRRRTVSHSSLRDWTLRTLIKPDAPAFAHSRIETPSHGEILQVSLEHLQG